MKLSRMARESKETIRRESDERVRFRRPLVVRDVVIAVAVMLALAFLGRPMESDPNEVTWFVALAGLPLVVLVVMYFSVQRHKASTPEKDRAEATQMALAVPGATVLAFLLTWPLVGDAGEALQVAALGGVGVGVVAVGLWLRGRHGGRE